MDTKEQPRSGTTGAGAAQIEDGGPAFPAAGLVGRGLTMRDYFAAKAVQGWLASYGADSRHPADNDTAVEIARLSYAMADAMLAARKTGGAA